MRAFAMAGWLAVGALQAQELVPNGDLEQYTQCPDYVSQIDRAVGWARPTQGTSDYFNACVGVPWSENVPDNEFGDQPAHSGNGYAGFYCFYATTAVSTAPDTDHEYVTHALAAPLIPGRSYQVEFYVSLADVSHYAVNDIGALLSVHAPHRNDDLAITATPQVMNTGWSWLDDKAGWTRLHGCVVADSAYAYITIGNFHVGAATVFEEVPTSFPLTYYSYYYVDDVSVRPMTTPLLGPDTTICGPTQLAVLNAIPGETYTWSTGATGAAIEVDAAGTYSVQDQSGDCLATDTIVVTAGAPVTVTLPADTAIDLCAHGLVLRPPVIPSNAALHWSTGMDVRELQVNEGGTYGVSATAIGYCAGHASITVTDVCGSIVYAPNAFTPNGDGINDSWGVHWLPNDGALIQWTVFDRWGEEVFRATDGNTQWDGSVDGRPLPSGIYFWRGRARDPAIASTRQVMGQVLLLR